MMNEVLRPTVDRFGIATFSGRERAVRLKRIHADRKLGTFEWVDRTRGKQTAVILLSKIEWD